jgi:hypothetical protein
MAKTYRQGNQEFQVVSVRKVVTNPEFRLGYQDRLAGRPPPPFYLGEDWSYERGRLARHGC